VLQPLPDLGLPHKTTGWAVWDRILVGMRFSAPPDWPWGPPSLLYNGYRVFPRGTGGRGMGLTPPPPSSAKVLERVELYLYSLYPKGLWGL